MLSASSVPNHSGLLRPWQAASIPGTEEQRRSDFVELPPVWDFHELRAHEDFSVIQMQFLSEVRELKQLARAYVSHRYDNAIDRFLDKLETPTDDLFASLLPLYRETRFQIHRLVGQLKGQQQGRGDDRSQQDASVNSLIASVLHDCLDGIDLCPAGIHSRFARRFLDLEAIMNGGLTGRLYKQRKDVFCEFIQAFLWQNQREGNINLAEGMEVHWFNALYNLYCDNLALTPVDDPRATTNLPDELLSHFLQSAPVLVSACVILRRIADNWCEKLISALASVGCCHWLTSRTSSDENTAIGIDALISEVFNPINTLMGTTTDKPLNLAAVADLCSDESFHMKRHREKILAWLAGYFYQGRVTVFAQIAVRSKTYIGSINELFFWVFEHDRSLRPGQPCCFTPDQHTSLTLLHLRTIDFSSWPANTSHALLTQAMEQTDDPGEIAAFFLDQRVSSQLIRLSQSVRQVLSNQLLDKLLRHTSAFKEVLCQKVCACVFSYRRSASNFSLGWLVNTPLLEPVLTRLLQGGISIYRVTRSLNIWHIVDWPLDRLRLLLMPEDCRRLFKQALKLGQIKTVANLLLTEHCDELAFSSRDRLSNAHFSGPPRSELLNLFARHGDLAALKYLLFLAQRDTLTRAESSRAQAVVVNQRGKYGSTPLLSAAKYGHVECLQELVNIPGVKINIRNEAGYTPLHLAVEYGRLSCVRALLETGQVDLNGNTLRGMTPLNTATVKGYLDIVRTLLSQTGIDVNMPCQRHVAPLQHVAQCGRLDILRLLLAMPEIEVNARDIFGWTALNNAATEGHLHCVQALLQVPGILVNESCNNGWVPLHGSAHHGHSEVVRALLQAPGIDVNLKNHKGWTALNNAASEGSASCVQALLEAPGVEVNEANISGFSPLITAAQRGASDCVRLLLEAPGIDVNHLCNNGMTALSHAARFGHLGIVRQILAAPKVLVNLAVDGATALFHAAYFGHVDILRELLQVPEVCVNSRRIHEGGLTPLAAAAQNGHLQCVRELTGFGGVDVNRTNNVGWTPLNFAARFGQHQCVEQLIQAPGIEINKANMFGRTPLHHATGSGHWECVRALSQAVGINANRLTTEGEFALGIAAGGGFLHCLQMLLATPGIRVNMTGADDASALHLAVSSDHPHCVRALLQARGIDINKRDRFNLTPLDRARQLQFRECAGLLLQAQAQIDRKRPLSRDPSPPAKAARHDP